MFKIAIAAGLVSLLAACSGMSTSSTNSMGASGSMQPGTMQNGTGPRGASGGGPN